MDEDVQKIKKRTRRKKRSNTKRENGDVLSQESNNSTNAEDGSPAPVKRVLRNRNITDEDIVVKKRTRKRRKKKSIPEETDNTESSGLSPVKSIQSAVNSSCISSTDDSKPQNSPGKFDSQLLRLKRSVSNHSVKQDELDTEVTGNDENDEAQDVRKVKETRFKKKKKINKQSAVEMDVSDEQQLINDTFDHITESYVKTPATKSSKKKKSNEWIEATEHNFGEVDIPTNSKRETYQLENSTVQPSFLSTPANKKSSTSKKKSNEWIEATEHNFGELDITTDAKRDTYQLENSTVQTLLSSAVKQRKKWDLSNVSLNYSTEEGMPVTLTRKKSLFGTPSGNSTPETSVRLSTRASTIRKTPFAKKKSIVKLGGSLVKKRDSIRKSTLKNSLEGNFVGEILGVDDDRVRVSLRNKRRSSSLDLGTIKSRKSKVSFAVKHHEIVDSSFVSDDDGNFKQSEDNVLKAKRRTYSFDGIEKVPVFCQRNVDKSNDYDKTKDYDKNNTDVSLLNHTFLQDSPKLIKNESLFELTDDSFVTRRRHNTSKNLTLDTTSPPNWNVSPPKTESKRLSLSKKLSKPKLSPKLSTTLKASRKTPKISGEKAQAFLNLINDSNPKLLRGRPSGTSTPATKTTASKSILSKTKKNITFNESVSSPSIAKIKRSKMPNFSLIHQKQFERMESISTYKERREERAKVLLSGNKIPHCYSNAKNSSNVTLDNSTKVTCNKQLEFNKSLQTNNKTQKKEIPPPTIKNKTPSKANATLSAAIQVLNVSEKSNKASTSNPPLSNKNVTIPKVKPKSHLPVMKKTTVPEKTVKENPKEKPKFNTVDKTNHTKFGFARIPAKSSKEELVALANKTRVPQVNVQARRNMIQGVRSNRRFELLMNMRKK